MLGLARFPRSEPVEVHQGVGRINTEQGVVQQSSGPLAYSPARGSTEVPIANKTL